MTKKKDDISLLAPIFLMTHVSELSLYSYMGF